MVQKKHLGYTDPQMLRQYHRYALTFADSHEFWDVVETAGHFPAIYLQTNDLVVGITLPVFMRKINP